MYNLLTKYAFSINIKKIGFANVTQLEETTSKLLNWLDNGFAGNMSFLSNNINKRNDPKLILENAKTVIAIAEPYPFVNNTTDIKIAKYAMLEDYHIRIRNKLILLSEFIEKEFNKKSYISVDAEPVFEKEWAVRCGLGWQGKNSLIISNEFGSYFNIGILFTELECNIQSEIIESKCGKCTLCIDNCPTKAIIAPKTINANKCISYSTNEAKMNENIFGKDKIAQAGYILGCDICQDICPFNQKIKNKANKVEPDQNISDLLYNLDQVLNMTNKEFERKFEKYTIKRLRLNRLKRNIDIINNKTTE